MLEWVGAGAFVVGVVFIAVSLFLLLRRTVDFRRLEQHNDVAGFIYSVVGIVYGVLLAFVVIVVWQHHAATERAVASEADSIIQIYRDADAFPQAFQDTLRARLHGYAATVVAHAGRRSDGAGTALNALWNDYAQFVPLDANDRTWYAEILRRLNRLALDREERLQAATQPIPALMWVVLLVGGAVTVGFSFLFGTSNVRSHALMIAGLTLTLALPIVVIWALEHPFSALGRIDTAPLHHALLILGGGLQ